ncbi:hypothetical protein [Nannocystis bainbridge]|uniref:Uncharacterized protein n=1 Tax=Nannocystis bainbridge TaxID=2995303 RepID=A0ABT5ECG4_9BACT|nr:hypothetical protein [Nannocystis bainbridge]MDC0723565.1 hypothetical protein [Nannocystis bainbridge]
MPATFQKHCDIYQGYNFKKDVQTPVGFLTELKIGDVTLKADQTCKDPMAPETDLAVVTVLSGVLWELGVTDGLYFSGQISVFNKQQIKQLAYKDLSKVDVSYNFSIYEYDPLEKKYFKCLLPTDKALDGLLEKRGGDLNIDTSDDASTEVQSPENYAFQIGVKPQPLAQTITVATSFSVKIVKAWGLKVEK